MTTPLSGSIEEHKSASPTPVRMEKDYLLSIWILDDGSTSRQKNITDTIVFMNRILKWNINERICCLEFLDYDIVFVPSVFRPME